MQMWISDEYVVLRNNLELPNNIRNFVTFRRAPIFKNNFRSIRVRQVFDGIGTCSYFLKV